MIGENKTLVLNLLRLSRERRATMSRFINMYLRNHQSQEKRRNGVHFSPVWIRADEMLKHAALLNIGY